MKPIREKPVKIGTVIKDFLSKTGYLNFCREFSIIQKWSSIVDNGLAKTSTCERVENGIVYVKVSSSSWRQEAIFHKEDLIQRIKNKCDCTNIKDIVFY